MEIGGFGGQSQALRREVQNIEREERQRGNRRAFLGSLAGATTGALGAWAMTSVAVDTPTPEPDAGAVATDPMHRVATGPLPELIRVRTTFLTRIQSGPIDSTLAIGLARLVEAATTDIPERPGLAASLLDLRDVGALPSEFGPFLDTLQSSFERRNK